MKVIPFKAPKSVINKEIDNHLLDEFYVLEEQIEKIDFEIDEKEKKLIKLSQWKCSETYFEYDREIDFLKRDKVVLEKKRMKIMAEMMEEKEGERND